ncbi:hypothetical protein QN412_02995 [Pseudomonas sp. RTB3]|uniref:hypothetical protein n=1 Tax=unclassified Pseudomonas TaxID=196821 RepID=UPI002B234C0D|nr:MULTISPECIES: hypothetical protein [unclassified Pseudomonas]MEB0008643.1 hypothetical protein [Pseudomonas sp. RTB2]MEB0015921.1 hypothetical protein [Pseudomonas sp. RTB3]MEB0270865.1 hypothetical protein [Pseudomonas sp. 5B4]
MKKRHGPDFRKAIKPLRECLDCRGTGLVSGVFHQMECATCNASGWVCEATGQALPLEELVLQLNMKLRAMARDLAQAGQASGAQQQYEQNNRRGAGGSNYTGD